MPGRTSGCAIRHTSFASGTRKTIESAKSIRALALLATALNAVVLDANAQPFADSVGASSQTRGELATTPAGIVPRIASADAHAGLSAVAMLGDMPHPRHADSTGGDSAERAALLLEHARDGSTAVSQLGGRDMFQPYPDSTGGSSITRPAFILVSSVDARRDRNSRLASR